jgi:hypothetical protein
MRVSGPASHEKFAPTPATSADAGSKPSGGRVNVVFCVCWIAVKVTVPWSLGNSVARPKIDVGASAKRGFSS